MQQGCSKLRTFVKTRLCLLLSLTHIKIHFATFYLIFCRGSTPPVQPCPALRPPTDTNAKTPTPIEAPPAPSCSGVGSQPHPRRSKPKRAWPCIFWLARIPVLPLPTACSLLSAPTSRLPSTLLCRQHWEWESLLAASDIMVHDCGQVTQVRLNSLRLYWERGKQPPEYKCSPPMEQSLLRPGRALCQCHSRAPHFTSFCRSF